jgi:hypothetical protein
MKPLGFVLGGKSLGTGHLASPRGGSPREGRRRRNDQWPRFEDGDPCVVDAPTALCEATETPLTGRGATSGRASEAAVLFLADRPDRAP